MRGLLFHLMESHPYARFGRQDEYIEDWRALCTTFKIDVLVCVDQTNNKRASQHMWTAADTAFEIYETVEEALEVWKERGQIYGFEQERHSPEDAVSILDLPKTDSWLVVTGADEGGFNDVHPEFDEWCYIPVPKDRSLWAQQAAAIILWEFAT